MKVLLYIVVIASIFVFSVSARPSSSPKYSEALSKANTTLPPYAKYDTVNITVHARDNITKQEWTSIFYPRVDEFSLLELAGTAQKNFTFNPNLTVWVEFPRFPNLTALRDAPKRVYMQLDSERTDTQVYVPYFTALVLLDKGRAVDFQWDAGCKACASDQCIDDQCGAKRIRSNEDVCESKANCNIKVYLAWMGRDKDDSKCRSVASRPNSFNQYSVAPLTNFGNGLYDDVIYRFTQNAPNPLSNEP